MRRQGSKLLEAADTRVVAPGALLDLVRGVVASGGSLWVRVTGLSMNPLIREGDSVLLARPLRPARSGDVVFLDIRGMPVLHRVRTHAPGVLVTRGDAACRDDEPVLLNACVAQAVAVRRGSVTIVLAPTLRFGVMPFLWMLAWKLRVRVPSSISRTIQPLSRAFIGAGS